MTSPHEWLKSIGATESLREIAARAGVSHATLSRQITNGQFLIDTTIALARAYDAPVIGALVANGHLSPEEGGLDGIELTLAVATDEQLVAEVGRRLGVSEGSLFDMPISEAVASSNVTELRPNVGATGEDEPGVKQPPATKRAAAKKGTRKGDDAPFTE